MTNFDKEKFLNPERKYRVRPMMHAISFKDDPTAVAKAVKAFGYGGAVINPCYNQETFVDEQSVAEFKERAESFLAEGLEYWIYDEMGYPSGIAAGLAVKGNRELEAKGIYMVRRIAYEPRHSTFTIDDETDKIVWAAKYPVDIVKVSRSYVRYCDMIPVPFTDTHVECDLNENEAFFIFCQKSSFEGTHLTHNVSGQERYINVMDKRAVRRFIDIAYEPIAKHWPEAYKKARAVFTDEPSLQLRFNAPYETWPYALAPYCDGLFDRYEQEYGTSLLPYLPLLFENGEGAGAIRVNFYRLVAKLIAEAYSGQLSEWCREHGGSFSGHYLAEESLCSHVHAYGDNLPVIAAADYPGIDILNCTPENYNCNTAKYVQTVVRSKGTNGMMVELCPFNDKAQFQLDPWNNMSDIVGLLALSGVRRFNSYFRVDFTEFDRRFNEYVGCNYPQHRSMQACIKFNEYVGRIGYMLDGLQSDCNVYVYRPIEDAQSKYIPSPSAALRSEAGETDGATAPLVKFKIFPTGVDFQYIGAEELSDCVENAQNGRAFVAGHEMKVLIVPGVDLIDSGAQAAMVRLKEMGVTVLFNNKIATLGTDPDCPIDLNDYFEPTNPDKIVEFLTNMDTDFTAKCDGVQLHTAKYNKDGQEMHFIVNNTRGIDAELTLNHKTKSTATLYDPVDGGVKRITVGEKYTVPSFRSMFVVFD